MYIYIYIQRYTYIYTCPSTSQEETIAKVSTSPNAIALAIWLSSPSLLTTCAFTLGF